MYTLASQMWRRFAALWRQPDVPMPDPLRVILSARLAQRSEFGAFASGHAAEWLDTQQEREPIKGVMLDARSAGMTPRNVSRRPTQYRAYVRTCSCAARSRSLRTHAYLTVVRRRHELWHRNTPRSR